MRITNDTYTKLAEQAAAAKAAAEKRESGSTKAAAPGSAAPEGVKVTMSAKARELAAAAPADFDEAKVARLKSAIEGGTFQIDAHHIARKLVEGT